MKKNFIMLLAISLVMVLLAQQSFEDFKKNYEQQYQGFKDREAAKLERFYQEQFELQHSIFSPKNEKTLKKVTDMGISEEQVADITNILGDEIEFSAGKTETEVVVTVVPEAKDDFETEFLETIIDTHNITKKEEDNKIEYVISKKEEISQWIVEKGVIANNLKDTLKSLKLSDQLTKDIEAQLSGRIDINTELKNGDKFTIMYENIRTTDNKTQNTKLFYMAFDSAKLGTLEAYRFEATDKADNFAMFLPNGEKVAQPRFRNPLDKLDVSSPYGVRIHPISKKKTMHNGIDYRSPRGTSVYAVAPGKVQRAATGHNGGFGNVVEVRHDNGDVTLYAHLDTIKVRQNDTIGANTVIGTVGSTGNSTGPHLHLGYMVNKKWANPLNIQMQSSVKLEGNLLVEFNKQKEAILEVLRVES